MLSYKITIAKQGKYLLPLLIRYLILLAIYYYFFGFVIFSPLLWWLALFFLLTDIIPTIAIHIQYFLWNSNSILEIDRSSGTFYYADKYSKLSFTQTEISTIERVHSFGDKMGWYSFGNYQFTALTVKEQRIYLTCLITGNQLNEQFGDKITSKGRVVAFLPIKKLK